MRPDSTRWVEVTPSRYGHERAALDEVRSRLPDARPYRAWSNLEIVTDRGRSLEVDLLVLGPRGLYLVEFKHWKGRITGDRYNWMVISGGDSRMETNPFLAAEQKARVLKGLLSQARERLRSDPAARGVSSEVVPFVQAAVYLHHPEMFCELLAEDRAYVFGPDGARTKTGLPELVKDLLTKEPADPASRISANQSELIARLLTRIGMGRRQPRTVGPYVLDESPFDSGPSWQDFLATHQRFREEQRRIRIYNVGSATTAEERLTLERAAEREYRLLRYIQHPGLVVPVEYHDPPMGPSLVYVHDPKAERLDRFLARHGQDLSIDTQMALIRAVAEVLRYAHGRRITHRGLSARSVLVRMRGNEAQVQIADWQTGARDGSTSSDSSRSAGTVLAGTRHLASLLDHEFEVYQAPESLRPDPDEVRLDVFGLGALSYLILTGRPPASDLVGLQNRLQQSGGLDLAGDLEGPPESLRSLVLDATRGDVSARLPDVETFMEALADVEKDLRDREAAQEEADPIAAPHDAVLEGRWKVVRSLGGGASAVALLVEDLEAEGLPLRVLKIARDNERAARLQEEASVLRGLDHPGIVSLRGEGPIALGQRMALVLDYAGPETLAGHLRKAGGRLSLDRLERFGEDLLAAVSYLDSKGVNHRDIKPANLGVKERPADREKHLILFDFSLSKVSTGDIQAGTQIYLDPFLGGPGRHRWDDHAERYAVTVTLFEMATGRAPAYGDGKSLPNMVDAEATLTPTIFDPAVAEPMVAFFEKALRREAKERLQTVDEMRQTWSNVFRQASTVGSGQRNLDALAERATLATSLGEAGLSIRAQSALEPLGVATVQHLLAVQGWRLSRLAGANEATRREIRQRVKQWRQHLVGSGTIEDGTLGTARSIDAVVDGLIPGSNGQNGTEIRAARLLLGRPADEEAEEPLPRPWLNQTELADLLGVSRGRAQQIDARLRARWARDRGSLEDVRQELVEQTRALVVVTAQEAATALLVLRGSTASKPLRTSQALGLIRAAVESELERGGEARFDRRRLEDMVLLAPEPEPGESSASAAQRIDHALALGRAAAELVVDPDRDTPIPGHRALERLRQVPRPSDLPPIEDGRLLRLAAATSGSLAVSTREELYRRGLDAGAALRHCGAVFGAFDSNAHIPVETIQDRVRARFPEAAPLPPRPDLDALLDAAGLPLRWDPAQGAYRPSVHTGQFLSSSATAGQASVNPDRMLVEDLDRRLRDSIHQRAFLALGAEPRDLEQARIELVRRHGARILDVSALLIRRMRQVAAEAEVPWPAVLSADAADPGSQEGQGLRGLVRACLASLEEEMTGCDPGVPILLTSAAPLARYGHLDRIARLADHTAGRNSAIWLLVPIAPGQAAPVLDGEPVPVVTASQWLRLPEAWVQTGSHQVDEAVG